MTGEELPRARVRRRRLFRLVWVVPVVALAVAGWLVFQHLRSIGPEISITFADGAGLRPGQTPLKYRGVAVGEVSGVELSPDQRHVVVRVRLARGAAPRARGAGGPPGPRDGVFRTATVADVARAAGGAVPAALSAETPVSELRLADLFRLITVGVVARYVALLRVAR
jgi:hypothetical protein